MTTQTVDLLVGDYLARLDLAARVLPPDRRAELREEIAEHIEGARAAGAAADEAAVRTLLDRLGDPEVIVAAAREDSASSYGGEGRYGDGGQGRHGDGGQGDGVWTQPGTGLEAAAVGFLTVGSFVPVVGWLVGVALLWSSKRWRTWEKVLGTLVVPFGPGLVLVAGSLVPGQTCSTTSGAVAITTDGRPLSEVNRGAVTTCTGFSFPPWLGIPLLLVVVIAPFVVGGLLYARARSRAATEPAVLRPAGQAGRGWGGLEIAAVLLLSAGTFVLPVVGPIIGLVLVVLSDRWTGREKGIATALVCAPLVILAVLLLASLSLRGGG